MNEVKYRNKKNSLLINIILCLLLIIVCTINILLNISTYKNVLSNNYKTIKGIDDISNDKFYYINMKDIKEENYKLENKNAKIKIYSKNIDNKKLLILLNENTILADKVSVKKLNDLKIKKTLNSVYKNDYYEVVLTNIDYSLDIKICLCEFYISVIVIIISILSSLIDLYIMLKMRNYNVKL